MSGDQGARGLDRILELQDLDLAIDRLQARRRELESGEDIRIARERVDGLEERVGETRLALGSIDQEQRRLETEVATLDAKIGAEERRLYDGSVANPKELESIQHEVQALHRRKSLIEDDVLSQMERREEVGSRLPPMEAELAEARDRLAEIGGDSVRELEDIGRALAERIAERAALATAFDEELLELYEDLRAQKRGVGAAALLDGVCQGCHQKLSPLELERIKRSEGIRRCEYCRRILVLA
ncbi:MAG TPA: C4-type zinc ribbon domain-containing protein [Actinomycetota bacterium]|nr:C4-type zinc ribbon domain-containing protein [Actinomycetota bacterium]